ncbi:hypothetical protein EXW51_18840 [Bacillus mycoides]|nr:hypothetical protein EXW51_18840 [Bacillus mycoides]
MTFHKYEILHRSNVQLIGRIRGGILTADKLRDKVKKPFTYPESEKFKGTSSEVPFDYFIFNTYEPSLFSYL